MNNKIYIAVIVIILAAVFYYGFNKESEQVVNEPVLETEVETVAWQTFKSDVYGFEFKYPADYTMEFKDYADSFELTTPENKIFLISLFDYSSNDSNIFEEIAFDRSMSYCASDGQEWSTGCPSENRKIKFTNLNGIDGYEIYLNHRRGNSEDESFSVRGPVYALNLLPIKNKKNMQVMLLNPTANSVNNEIIKQIISTVKFDK